MSPAEDSSAAVLSLEAPVAEVTLFEDRGLVVRRGRIPLEVGNHRLRVPEVTPVMSDRTLSARSSGAVQIHDVRVARRWRIGDVERPPEAAEVEKEIQRLRERLDACRARHAAQQSRSQLLAEAAGLHIDSVNLEMPFAAAFEPRWEEGLEALFAERRVQVDTVQKSVEEMEELDRALGDARLHHLVRDRPEHVLAAELIIDLEAQEAGEVEIEVRYIVACAMWRPVHRASLIGDGVKFECEAAVWQATGEDWVDVETHFSTARSTQRADPPVLRTDQLAVQRKTEKKVSVAIRETMVANTGEGGGGAPPDGLPGVDDGGETRLLDARGPALVRADGWMRRVPLFTFEAEAERDRLCCPEIAPLVHLRSRQENAAAHPLLAGPVDLLREGGYVGCGEIGYVAAGERFALGWGSEDGLRVRRETRETRDTARITGKQRISRTVELSLSNLGDGPETFTLRERIPVSEIDRVGVELDRKETKPPATPDEQGMVSWNVGLPAHGTEKITLNYHITAASDVEGL